MLHCEKQECRRKLKKGHEQGLARQGFREKASTGLLVCDYIDSLRATDRVICALEQTGEVEM